MVNKKKQFEQDRKQHLHMGQEIRVTNNNLGNANKVAVSSARMDRRVLLILSVLPQSSADYKNLMQSVCKEEICEDNPCEVWQSDPVRKAVHECNGNSENSA